MSADRKWPSAVRIGIVLAFAATVALHVDRLRTQPASEQPAKRLLSTMIDTTASWKQVVLTYIGDPRCAVCSDPEFKKVLGMTVRDLRRLAAGTGYDLRTVGVALSGDSPEDLQFLSQSGEWDEVSLGGGWLNTHAQTLIWDRAARPLTPQVLVSFRTVSRSPGGNLMIERALPTIAFVGAAEIRAMTTGTRRGYIFPPMVNEQAALDTRLP